MSLRRLAPLAPFALYLALSASFASKPFHVDDALFVGWAKHLTQKPAEPLGYQVVWLGKSMPMVRISPNPPLHAYILASAMALSGDDSEQALHYALLPFGFLALWAVGALARRFGVSPLAAQLLVAVSPVLVLASHSVMPDVVVFALSATAVALGLRALDEERSAPACLAGLALGAAVLARYNAVAIVVLLAFYALAGRKPWRPAAVLFATTALIVAPWLVLLGGDDVGAHFATMVTLGGGPSARSLGTGLLCVLVLLGGVTLFPPIVALSLATRRRLRFVVLGLFAVLVAVFAWLQSRGLVHGDALPWLLPPMLVGGFFFAAESAARVVGVLARWRHRDARAEDDLFLCLWLLGLLLLPVIYIHVSAKYLLPAMPPIVLLFLRRTSGRWQRGLVLAAVVGGALLSSMLGAADREFAELAPRVARDVVRPLVREGGRTVWFTPEWGYAIYLAREGARPLHDDATPNPGDLIVTTETTPPHDLLERMNLALREKSRRSLRGELPLVTMNSAANAGYYSNHWGWLPFAPVARGTKLERVRVLEVLPAAAAAAPEKR